MRNDEHLKEGFEESWEKAGIESDFIFGKVMYLNSALCRRLIQAVLPDIKVKKVVNLERQKDIWNDYESKGIRLDIYAEDEDNRIFTVEMQLLDDDSLPLRIRYYRSMTDLQLVDKGEAYGNIPDSYLIFLCTFDHYGKGRRVYTFPGICLEDSEVRIGDGVTQKVVNAKGHIGEVSDDLQQFMDLMLGRDSKGEFAEQIKGAVKEVKESREWRREYMTYWMKMNDAKKLGIKEGMEQGLRQGQNTLVTAIQRLRAGESEEDLRNSGVDEDTISLAVSCK